MLRGGAYKPRTSLTSSRDWGRGPALGPEAKEETGLPIVTELMDPRDVGVVEAADALQVGAGSMQNYTLLSEAGRTGPGAAQTWALRHPRGAAAGGGVHPHRGEQT